MKQKMKKMKKFKSFAILSLVVIISFGTYSFLMGQGPDYSSLISEKIKTYNPPRKDYVIVIDYKKSIMVQRLYVINVKTNETVISSKVSHAFNSGILFPTNFSNVPGTNKSCYGAFLTGSTVYGKFGYSMWVHGQDRGINNNACSRAIIFHPDTKMPTMWSSGCFATSEETNKKIIDLTKNGCLVVVLK